MAETKVHFTVSGPTLALLNKHTQEVIKSLLRDSPEGSVTDLAVALNVRPLIESFGSDVPDIWEAEVEVTIG